MAGQQNDPNALGGGVLGLVLKRVSAFYSGLVAAELFLLMSKGVLVLRKRS